jgi:hypothetical protein
VELDQVPGKDKQFTGYVPPFIGISEQHHTPPRLDELEAGFYMRRFWVEVIASLSRKIEFLEILLQPLEFKRRLKQTSPIDRYFSHTLRFFFLNYGR